MSSTSTGALAVTVYGVVKSRSTSEDALSGTNPSDQLDAVCQSPSTGDTHSYNCADADDATTDARSAAETEKRIEPLRACIEKAPRTGA